MLRHLIKEIRHVDPMRRKRLQCRVCHAWYVELWRRRWSLTIKMHSWWSIIERGRMMSRLNHPLVLFSRIALFAQGVRAEWRQLSQNV